MLRVCGDHLSLLDVQHVQWMFAPSCCAWRMSCGGLYRYGACDFPSWLPLKEGNHDSHLLGPGVQVLFILCLFFFCFLFIGVREVLYPPLRLGCRSFATGYLGDPPTNPEFGGIWV